MSERCKIALLGPGALAPPSRRCAKPAHPCCGRTAHAQLTLRHDAGEISVPGPVLHDASHVTQRCDLLFVAVKTTGRGQRRVAGHSVR